MQQTGTAPGRDGAPGHDGRQASALLGWWRDSGVDCILHERPQSWLAQPAAALDQTGQIAVAALAEGPKSPAIAIAEEKAAAPEDFSAVPSLAALVAHIAATCPGAPFCDGNPDSGVMLMGEAPSAEDLRTGRPFSGPAGQLLDRMLMAIGLDRQACYISLLAPRRRIPGPPPADAIAADLPLARAHVRLARPRVLLLLGKAATHAMTGETAPISRLRGHWLDVVVNAGEEARIPALPTFNPAYLLRRPEDKALAWADLLEFKRRLRP